VAAVIGFSAVFNFLGKSGALYWLQIVIALMYPLFRLGARGFASSAVATPARLVDKFAQRRHDKNANFPLPDVTGFYADIAWVELYAVPLADVITTMGIQVVMTETTTLITLLFALGDIAMCAKGTRTLLKAMGKIESDAFVGTRPSVASYPENSREVILAAYRIALEEQNEIFTAVMWFAIFSAMQISSVQFFGFPMADYPAYLTNAVLMIVIQFVQYLLFRALIQRRTGIDIFRVQASIYCNSLYKRIFGPFVMTTVWLYLGSKLVAFGVDVTLNFDWIIEAT
jgi:hypothetical protein